MILKCIVTFEAQIELIIHWGKDCKLLPARWNQLLFFSFCTHDIFFFIRSLYNFSWLFFHCYPTTWHIFSTALLTFYFIILMNPFWHLILSACTLPEAIFSVIVFFLYRLFLICLFCPFWPHGLALPWDPYFETSTTSQFGCGNLLLTIILKVLRYNNTRFWFTMGIQRFYTVVKGTNFKFRNIEHRN